MQYDHTANLSLTFKEERFMEQETHWNLSAKLCIAEALISLLKEQELASIHIKDLVKKAGVSRTSYYRHFNTKEEILSYYMEYVLERYIQTIDMQKKSPFQSYEHILDSLLFFKEYKDFALCLYKSNLTYILMNSLNEYIRKQPIFDASRTITSFPLYYYAGALYNVYMQWILNDTKEAPEELAKIIAKIDRSPL